MLIPNIVPKLAFILLPYCYATSNSSSSDNALALIEGQSDLKLVAGLIRRDPELVELYSSVENATIVLPVDSSFPTTDTSAVIYSNKAATRAILQANVIEGQYPTTAITGDPIYANTKLSDPRSVDTSRGRAVAKLVEVEGEKTLDSGAGTRANITTGDLRFRNGILHKLSNPLSQPDTFFQTAARLDNIAISKLPTSFISRFVTLTGSPDTTLFGITNEASNAATAANPNATFAEFVDIISYFIVTPGVYFENTFTGQTVQTLNGADLTLSGFGTGTTRVNDAVVVRSDIFTTNGVFHILDRSIAPAS